MSRIPPAVAQPVLHAQETPLQSWVSNWLAYLSDNLSVIFLVVAVLAGIIVLVKGGIKQVVMFAVGAALAFLLLTNLEDVAQFLRNELPLDSEGVPAPTDPPETPDPE